MKDNGTTPSQPPDTLNVWIEEEEDLTVRPMPAGFLDTLGLSAELIKELEEKERAEKSDQEE